MQKTLFYTALLMLLAMAAMVAADPLTEIAQKVEGKARRASSGVYDPESNADCYHVFPGETKVLTTLKGPGEIRHMWFTLANSDRRYPRTAVLRIYWDGAKTPSVETPIGDFFAAGNGMRANVDTLPLQTTSYGRALNCYWRMPFAKEARIEITNEGTGRLSVYWQFDWMELEKPPKDMLYFHARYRQEYPAKPFSPYVIFDGRGEGQYVGTVFSIQCSYGSWFGESDDRFYIDDEAEPSLVGTGCEDYFNDAWNLREFSNDNTGVTIKEPNGEDCRFTAYRWHIRAPVTFKKSLKVDMERRSFALVKDPKTGRTEHYDFKYRPDLCSSVAFWYQTVPAERFWEFPPVEERINKEIFLETAFMIPQIKASPGTRVYRGSNRVCNKKIGFFANNTKIGGWFEVPCHVDEEGIYSISVYQCLFRDGGIWKVTLDGPTGPIVLDRAMDFYDPFLAVKENRPENYLYGTWMENKVGLHKLPPGDYTFRFECVGANPLSRRSHDDLKTPGLNCRLDGISLRRFPWDDLHAQMQKYLADEKKLFGGWIAEAEKTVDMLDRDIKQFRARTGRYPRDLNELALSLSSPSLVNEKPNPSSWRDPWGQLYHYDCPGKFNPDGFDVYSIHGDSSDATTWIGNWNKPYRLAGAIEGESLKVAAKQGSVSTDNQSARVRTAPTLSNQRVLFVRFDRKGDSITLALPNSIKPGKYRVRLQMLTASNYGILDASLNGQPIAKNADTFSYELGTKTIVSEPVTIRPGENTIEFTPVGRDKYSGGYRMGLDAVSLIPAK